MKTPGRADDAGGRLGAPPLSAICSAPQAGKKNSNIIYSTMCELKPISACHLFSRVTPQNLMAPHDVSIIPSRCVLALSPPQAPGWEEKASWWAGTTPHSTSQTCGHGCYC